MMNIQILQNELSNRIKGLRDILPPHLLFNTDLVRVADGEIPYVTSVFNSHASPGIRRDVVELVVLRFSKEIPYADVESLPALDSPGLMSFFYHRFLSEFFNMFTKFYSRACFQAVNGVEFEGPGRHTLFTMYTRHVNVHLAESPDRAAYTLYGDTAIQLLLNKKFIDTNPCGKCKDVIYCFSGKPKDHCAFLECLEFGKPISEIWPERGKNEEF